MSEAKPPEQPSKPRRKGSRRGLRAVGRVLFVLVLLAFAVWILIDLDRRASEMAHEAMHGSTGFSPPSVAQAPGVAVDGEFQEDYGSPGETFTVHVVAATNVQPPEVRTFRNRSDCGDTVWPYGGGGGTLGVSDSLVWLEGVTRGSPNYSTFLTISNSGCSLWPHVSTGAVGTTLTLENYLYSPEAYRVTLLDGETEQLIEQVSLRGMDTYTYVATNHEVALDRAGLVKVQSVLRPWETAFVLVCDHAYCAVSDWEGNVPMTGVPHGSYQLHAWHHIAGHQQQPLVVDPSTGGSTQTVRYP